MFFGATARVAPTARDGKNSGLIWKWNFPFVVSQNDQSTIMTLTGGC